MSDNSSFNAVFGNNGSGGGSGVQSVTGLNTDNTDPLNPVVKISVDNNTIVGDGTFAVPLSTQSIYGSFNSLTIQNLVTTNVAQRVQMENTIESNGISIIGTQNDTIEYNYAGLYALNFSLQFNHTTAISVDNAYVWLNYNGSNINSTTRQVILRPTFPFLVLELSYIVRINNNGDTIAISWTANSTDIELYFQSGGTLAPFPDIPSVIVNSFRIQ
jgi:hypothetical protein